MTVYVYTSIALNYFPKARVLSTTLKRFHPTWKFCMLVAEDINEQVRTKMLSYDDIDEVICHNQLNLTDGFDTTLTYNQIKQFIFKHSLVEFCTAIKGGALYYLLNKADCDAVFYFDPDIAIFDDCTQLTDHFQNNKSILLTPHLTDIEKTLDAVWDNEISTLKHGIYNLGFVGVKNDTNGRKFARWWRDRLDMYCYDDIPTGVFTDQSWCDMVPAVFDGVEVLRSPQYNVSTWNLNHRYVDGKDIHNLYVNHNYKLCFYHFSGFDSGAQLGMLTKYGQNMPQLFLLRDWYITQCNLLDNPEFSGQKWQFNYFSDGSQITTEHRKTYRQRSDLQKAFTNPFDTTEITKSYLLWYRQENMQNQQIAKTDLYKAELEHILTSTSWKITAPFRRISHFFQKLIK